MKQPAQAALRTLTFGLSTTMPHTPAKIASRWFHEVWNQRSSHLVRDLMADDAVGHVEGNQELIGPEEFFTFQNAILEALPDLQIKILRSISEGEDTCILWEASAIHSGYGLGFAPTGQSVRFRGTTWFRIVDGKIVEGWDSWNQAALLTKLASTTTA